LPYTLESRDVAAFAKEYKLSIEEAARQVRYGFLIEVALKQASRTIAVAHNADDQTESVLLHFLRGSGMSGLRGMLPKTRMEEYRSQKPEFRIPNSAFRNLYLVRPLLEVPRAAIEEYCQQNSLQPRIDATNTDTAYFRNRLRHELLPTLETYNPNIRSILRRTASVIAAEFEVLEAQTNSAWAEVVAEGSTEFVVFDSTEFKAQPLALQRALLRRAIQQLRPPLRDIDFVNIEDAIELIAQAKTGARATLPQELRLEVGYDSITISNANETILPDWPLLSEEAGTISIAIPGSTRLPNSQWIIEATILPEVENLREDMWNAHFDADSLSGSLSIRPRTSTDRFHPQGMPSNLRLKDWMINVKIPRAVRDRLPLIVSGDQIVWVAGFRVGQPFIVREDSKRIIKLTFRKD
jgi:tRNA(Ile)-lysidine synthase